MASDPPALVFPRPRTLEVRRMEVLEAQVRELRAEVRSLKTQLHAALTVARPRSDAGGVPTPTPSPAPTAALPAAAASAAVSAVAKKRKRGAAPGSPTDAASNAAADQDASARMPTVELEASASASASASAAAVAAVSAAGPSAHSLVQTTEFRETRSALGVTGRKLRQRSCKVCSVLRGDRKRAFETTFFCEECTASRGGGNVYLCDRVRQHEGEAYRGVTCSQIWHVLWDNGKALPVNGTTIRMRRSRKSEPDGFSSSSPLKEDKAVF